LGHDGFTDYAVDGGYQFIGDGTHVVSLLGIFDHENQDLYRTGALDTSFLRDATADLYGLCA
jgi:hypothetical protein